MASSIGLGENFIMKQKEQAPKAEEPLFKAYRDNTQVTNYDPIIEQVVRKINNRSMEGMEKYGKTMARTDIDTLQWLQHAQEEAMDLAVYLERLIQDYQDYSDIKKNENKQRKINSEWGNHPNTHGW